MLGIFLDDVVYWVAVWQTSGEVVSEAVARTIAAYWRENAETGALASLSMGRSVSREMLLEDIDSTIRYVRSGGFDTVELEALKAWALNSAADSF